MVAIFLASPALARGEGREDLPGRPLTACPCRSTKVAGKGTTTPSGLTFRNIKIGKEGAVTNGKAPKIHYTVWLETGQKFDNSVDVGPVVWSYSSRAQAK